MTRRLSLKLAGLVFSLFFCTETVLAQGDLLPSTVLPEKVSQGITEQQPVEAARTPALIAPPEQKAPPPLGAEAAKIKFKLNGVILVGNHVYTTEELSIAYKDKLHKTITIAQLFEIVQGITNYYRNNGYIISRAILPPQHVKNGIVKIQIIEGYIGNVSVSGDAHGAKCVTLAYGNRIKACPPLELSRMEHYLFIANETPATQVRAVLSPAKNLPGAADLTLVTKTTPVMGYVSYDDYGTRYIGPQQMTANLALNSAIASGDQLQATVTKTPKGQELTYADVNYALPLGDEGIRLLTGATRARTHPLFFLQPVRIDGVNKNYYTNATYPIIRKRDQTLTLRSGFNWLDTNVTTFGEKLYTDHLRNLDFGLTYNFSDDYLGSNVISTDIRQGLPIFDFTTDINKNAETSRPGGHAVYTKLTVTGSRLQVIKAPVSAYFLATGQYASQPLLASEQFAYGGSQLGRGYDVAELLGDLGLAGTGELRADWAINKLWINTLQFYAFYDIGVVWNKINTGSTPTKASATSTGVGIRFYFSKYVTGNLMWTQPLTKTVAAEALIGNGWKPREFFSVVWTFP